MLVSVYRKLLHRYVASSFSHLFGHNQPMMLLLGGISLFLSGAFAVQAIHEGVTVKEAITLIKSLLKYKYWK